MATVVNEDEIFIEKLVLGAFETNCYIIVCKKTSHSIVVDAPADASKIIEKLEGTQPQYILLTHAHGDHTGALSQLRSRLLVPLASHAAEFSSLQKPPELSLKDGDILKLGNLKINVLYTPGHTPGGLCFKIGKYLIAGDTIFPGGPGSTRSPESFKKLLVSITGKILTLPDDTEIYPGHGKDTTVKKSKEEYEVFASRQHRDNLCGDVLWLSA